ncbi:type II toxin-antitoxin system RelE/ParE family toxin [Petrimonas sp.]|uniref:type II toxin-antitoxin system RelE/ParE family toxin n=1 Tax=Petrimonas sp. TaxID=2023866 RepID=UPI003F5154C4
MARKIILSKLAREERKRILEYWNEQNQSKTYSIKLNKQFSSALKLIASFPQIGRQTDDKSARVKIVSHYLIIYEIRENDIYVLTFWDNRRNPEDLKDLIG